MRNFAIAFTESKLAATNYRKESARCRFAEGMDSSEGKDGLRAMRQLIFSRSQTDAGTRLHKKMHNTKAKQERIDKVYEKSAGFWKKIDRFV